MSYDEPMSGVVVTTRRPARVLGFRIVEEPSHGRLAGDGLIERVTLESFRGGFRARLSRHHEKLPAVGASLLLEIDVALEGGGAASLHLPVTLAGIEHSGLVAFLELTVDGAVETRAAEEPPTFSTARAV